MDIFLSEFPEMARRTKVCKGGREVDVELCVEIDAELCVEFDAELCVEMVVEFCVDVCEADEVSKGGAELVTVD